MIIGVDLMRREVKVEGGSARRAWMKRVMYLFLAFLVFLATPFLLNSVGYFVAGGDWTDFGETLFGDPRSGVTFLAGFAATIVIISVAIYSILSAFDTTEGAW